MIHDDDDLFNYDEITPEDKKFIMYIVDQTNFNGDKQIFNSDGDAIFDTVESDAETKKENEQDMINEGEKSDEAVKENIMVDEGKIKNNFTNKVEKLKKKKKICMQRVRNIMKMFKEERGMDG